MSVSDPTQTVVTNHNAPVVAEPRPPGLTLANGCDLDGSVASFDKASLAGRAKLVAALGASDHQFNDAGEAHITATEWAVVPRETVDEKTGEVRWYPWLCLFDKEGRTAGTSSEVVMEQLTRAMRLFTSDEWERGIPFTIRERRNRKGDRTYHDIRVDLTRLRDM